MKISTLQLLRTALITTTLTFASGVSGVVNAAPVIGTSAAVSGNVFVSTSGAQRKAQVRDAIKLQDRVLTKDNSALQILLLDQSTFTVGQNCSMTIDRFVFDPDTDVGQVSAKVAKGAFRFMSGRLGKKDPAQSSVSTPSATIGIRGTMFEGIVGIDAVALAQLGGIDISGAVFAAASIAILRGPGRNRNTLDFPGIIEVFNSAGAIQLTQPDFAVFVGGPGQAPIGPFRVTPEMQEYLDFFLRSEPNGPPEDPIQILKGGAAGAGQTKFVLPVSPVDEEKDKFQDGLLDRPVAVPPGDDEGSESCAECDYYDEYDSSTDTSGE